MLLQGLLTLIVAIPAFLFLVVLFPQTHAIFVPFWIVCLLFDISSTHTFYLENPKEFQTNERNSLFSGLTERFGFKKAAFIFPLAIELPLLLFFALLPLQILHSYLFSNAPSNVPTCLMASFGISAIGHLQAAIKNKHYTRSGHSLGQNVALSAMFC
ncbi:MAG: hypothetical protein LBH74_07075 [Nitrososphaerota archaeon]|jgi:hypothetical protein|uniref:hypothetical protein n=1 Tax=Candidatus Bathycorpusculum sp. TaxID=2994959 RepID=UPI00281CF39D|nr:hypothetical protein [Candidatus Termitimicrobium sp.]MCL2432178.1 hypothetical protein [Candidatus Termitimicrobium sp.]MDR0493380.1 hypothetical protein [Nitrososphaerota archaeon]